MNRIYKSGILTLLVLFILSFCAIKSIIAYYKNEKDHWKEIVRHIIQNCEENDCILVDFSNKICIEHYLAQLQNTDNINLHIKHKLDKEECIHNNIWVISYFGLYEKSNEAGGLYYKDYSDGKFVFRYSKNFILLDEIKYGLYPALYRLKRNLQGDGFYIKEEGEYILKATVCNQEKLDYATEKVRNKQEIDIRNSGRSPSRWKFSPHNCSYRLGNESLPQKVSVYFDGTGEENEFLQMKREDININLKDYPWLVLDYKVEDPQIQFIEIVPGIDIDKDRKVDLCIKGLHALPNSSSWQEFRNNLLAEAMQRLPGYKDYDLVFLELYPHKKYRKDCSREKNKRNYSFYIKSLYLFDKDLFYKSKMKNKLTKFTDGTNHRVEFKINGIQTPFRKPREFEVAVPWESIVWKRIYLRPDKYRIELTNKNLKCKQLFVYKL